MTGSFATPMDLGVEGEDVFVGPAPPDRGFRTHGGQVLAQSLGAAQRTVSSDRAVHSIHSYFLTAGHAAKPLDYGDFIETILPVVEHPWPGRSRPMDVRYVNAPTVPDSRPVTEPQVMWSCL